jgi:hypothetical protein
MSYIPLVSISGATVRTLRATPLHILEREPTDASPVKSHLILVIDQSGSMYYSMEEMRATLAKLLALEEYKNSDLLVSLVSYSGKGETYLRIEREPIASVMGPRGSGTTAIESLRASNLTCISGALKVAHSLTRAGEATTIVLHSDGYANDPSPYTETTSITEVLNDLTAAGVMLSTVTYGNADFALLDMIASKGGGGRYGRARAPQAPRGPLHGRKRATTWAARCQARWAPARSGPAPSLSGRCSGTCGVVAHAASADPCLHRSSRVPVFTPPLRRLWRSAP